MGRKKFRRDIRRRLVEAHRNIEWALYHFSQIEADMRSAAGLQGEEGTPLSEDELVQLPTVWQQLVRDLRFLGSGLMMVQDALKAYEGKI